MKKAGMVISVIALALSLASCSGAAGENTSFSEKQDTSVWEEQKTDNGEQEEKEQNITAQDAEEEQEEMSMNKNSGAGGTKQLGGISPEDALEYMKKTPDLVIVQVNTAEWKIEPGFSDALWIPHDEMEKRCGEIPEGRPVLLHCGAGVVSVPAYETLLERRPDIPELGYIDGSPHSIIPQYNDWLKRK